MSKTLLQHPATKENGALLITAEVKNKVAHLTIDGYIHPWAEASSKNLKREIAKLKKEGGATAHLYINSEGGVCFQANEMVNILNDAFGKENISVTVGALAASCASWILSQYNTAATAKRNSEFMIHKPSGGFYGTAAKIRKSLKSLENLEAQYKTDYAEALGISEDEVETMWKDGDHWMNAEEALDLGLIASIEQEDAEVNEQSKMALVAAARMTAEPKPTTKKETTTNIDMNTKQMALSLGLPEDATEAQIEEKAAELKAANEKLQKQLKQQEAAEATAKIEALLDQAEKDKKITADMRPKYEKLATADFDSAKEVIDSLQPVAKIETKEDAKELGGFKAKGKYKTYADYLEAGDKGAADFEALMQEDEDAAQALLDAYYPEKNPN